MPFLFYFFISWFTEEVKIQLRLIKRNHPMRPILHRGINQLIPWCTRAHALHPHLPPRTLQTHNDGVLAILSIAHSGRPLAGCTCVRRGPLPQRPPRLTLLQSPFREAKKAGRRRQFLGKAVPLLNKYGGPTGMGWTNNGPTHADDARGSVGCDVTGLFRDFGIWASSCNR